MIYKIIRHPYLEGDSVVDEQGHQIDFIPYWQG